MVKVLEEIGTALEDCRLFANVPVTDAGWILATENNIESKGEEADGEAKHKDDGDESNLLTPGLLHFSRSFA